jgi:hypothetical protein
MTVRTTAKPCGIAERRVAANTKRKSKNMQASSIRVVALASLATLLALPSVAPAQESPWRSYMSVSPVREDAELDVGGDVTVKGVILRGGTSVDMGGGTRAGLTVNYDYFDYSFANPLAFGGLPPWHIVQRYGFSTPVSFVVQDGWSIGVTPSFDWFKENGAKSSDSLVWGATATAVKRFDGGNILGIGFAAFSRIEENSFIPFPIVNWRFSDKWRVLNPLPAGPTGPAGLELEYSFDSGWAAGTGFAYRTTRYRLSQTGPTPNGVGQISGLPVFLRGTRNLGPSMTLNVYLGAVANGELAIEDSSGNSIRKEDFDLAPFLGANLVFRF